MAVAKVTYHWATGEKLECEVRVTESYPDAVAEAKAQAMALLRDGMGVLDTPDEAEAKGDK